jgi:hypothetical protein
LLATAPDGSSLEVDASATQSSPVRIQLPRVVQFDGTVRLGDGTPLAGQLVTVVGNGTYTGPDGHYVVGAPKVPSGGDPLSGASIASIKVKAELPTGLTSAGTPAGDGGAASAGTPISSTFQCSAARIVIATAPGTMDAVLPTRVISGMVLAPDGRPMAGATLSASNWSTASAPADAGTTACCSGSART